MNTYSGTELTEKINAFRIKKALKYPGLRDVYPPVKKDSTPSLPSRIITTLEKMNSFWAQNIYP